MASVSEGESDNQPRPSDPEPPVALKRGTPLRLWRGEMAVDKADGKAKGPIGTIQEVDRVGTLSLLALVLARAGADKPTIAKALEERDTTLDLSSYSTCHEEINYEELASKAVAQVINERKRTRSTTIPVIRVDDRPLFDITSDGLEAVEKANSPPVWFVQAGSLARIREDETGRPIIDKLGDGEVANHLTRVADFVRWTKQGPKLVPPPKVLVRDLQALGEWPFPPLEGIVELPILRPDGTVLTEPGYDPSTRLFYKPAPDLVIPSIPDRATRRQVSRALETVEDILWDFPFVDEASVANAIAMLIAPVCRQAIKGHVPIALCDAPKAGTGKGLLAEITSIIATGRSAAMFSAPKDEHEYEKQITATLLGGATLIVIDNVYEKLDSPNLAKAVTSNTWAGRILGVSQIAYLPQRATWIVNGNNISLGGDLPRRCYLISLDANMARPWLRTGFRHDDLERYVMQNRGQLVAAILTVVRGWVVAGRPQGDNPILGSFREWCLTIGGILAYAGVSGFLQNLSAIYERMDEDSPAWELFIAAWYARFGDQAVTVNELVQRLRQEDAFRETVPDPLGEELDWLMSEWRNSFTRKMGKALRTRANTYYEGGLRLERAGDDAHAGVARWRVRHCGVSG